MNWFDEYMQDSIAAAVGDTTPPSIAIISPTPSTAPGSPGGFSSDWATARITPIILEVTDLTPGIQYLALVCRYAGATDELVVYRRGTLRGSFVGTSSVSVITNGLRLSVLPQGGWPSSDALNDVTFEIDALDAAGNLAA